jgi:nucleoside-diphosphate-sugar epimerase
VLDTPSAHGIYNATRGASVPYLEIAHAASRAAGGDGTVERIPLEAARAQLGVFADALAIDLQIDSAKATRELGWEPHRPILLEELSNTSLI